VVFDPFGLCTSSHNVRKFGAVTPTDPQPDTLYSVREVAGQLGVHPETIRRLIHDGRLDAVRVGRVLRVHKNAVDGFLARQRIKPTRD
jgi:excisionase family DNA binding protein